MDYIIIIMDTTITTSDLYARIYELDILKANIYAVSLLDILKTQKLTADFCVKYILNTDFQLLEQDEQITLNTVKELQPHILYEDLVIAQVDAAKKRLKKERVDSFEDFESFSNRHI
jgi:hypothetical protein